MQNLDARLAEAGTEHARVFLTNALTGWEPRTTRPLPFLELEKERDRAKQETPILVILGSPPYNGYPGVAVDEERELAEAYRTTRQARGIERSLCPILPHGRTAHCGEDRAGCGLLITKVCSNYQHDGPAGGDIPPRCRETSAGRFLRSGRNDRSARSVRVPPYGASRLLGMRTQKRTSHPE